MTFSITQRLNTKEYVKTMFIGLYKKPIYILMTLLGIAIATMILLDHFEIADFYSETPWLEMGLCLFLFIAPSLVVLLSLKQMKANSNFLNDMTFTFTDTGYSVEATTFNSNILWSHILKEKEIGQYLILYHTKKFGNFIDKGKLTPEQLAFIKASINKK